jgi:molybdenum cofactor synthesis domain-containing protein
MPVTNPIACLLVIGNEVLSGRTQDANIRFLAVGLGAIGIPLREVRVIPDVPDTIITTVNEVRAKFDYVFTTGGIGPTHDDITADSVAKAFGVGIDEDPRAIAMMMERYQPSDLTPARRRMARIPVGADLVVNPISKAPGFRIGNVYVMAGVPNIMQAMFDTVAAALETGVKILAETIEAGGIPEGRYGTALAEIAAAHPRVTIGSYPSFADGRFRNQIVVRGKDPSAIAEARGAVDAMLIAMKSFDKPL